MRKLLKPNSLITVLLGLSKFRFYRKWWGGHWELWWVDVPVCSEIWHDLEGCSLESKKRPYGLLRGTPVCEQYGQPLESAVADVPFSSAPSKGTVSK